MRHTNYAFVLLLLFSWSALAQRADTASQALDVIQTLKAELEALKADYENRVSGIEAQIEDLQIQVLRMPEPEIAAVPQGAPSQTSTYSALNPAISVIGNFLSRADSLKVFNEEGGRIDNSFSLREVEVDMRVPVDPFADAVLITAFESGSPGEFDVGIEEGYINVKKLPFMESPLGLKFQVGRFRTAFGRSNLLHTHALPQSTRSLATQEFLGEEGFVQEGISLDFFVPTPWQAEDSVNARLQVLGGGGIAISPESRDRLAYLGNLRWFRTFRGTHNTELGWSTYWHPGRNGTGTTRLHGLDFMYRWKPFRQGEWKSYLMGGEMFFSNRSQPGAREPADVAPHLDPVAAGTSRKRPFGYSVFAQWQMDRRKYVGIRWDHTSTLVDPDLTRRSVTPYLSYYFSEFLRFRLNYERRWSDIRPENGRNSVFLELNWIFGAHPPEPFWVNR